MGRRLENWLSKANSPKTRRLWRDRWRLFTRWYVSAMDPLTGQPYAQGISEDMIDDEIRRQYETQPSHLFEDHWRDVLSKYASHLSEEKPNTAASYIGSVRSFFSNEAAPIRLPRGKVPQNEIAMGEHRFLLPELKQMYKYADVEGKAMLSVAVSLGWSVGDFLALDKGFIETALANEDEYHYVSFDWRRHKTKARTLGILVPSAVADLREYLSRVPESQKGLWTITTAEGINQWFKGLVKES
ncbi:hypothetical protein MUP00_02765, partial [Candidatus Bathyarchaeota archaeon]|nr:hypothetical protein [Candidatus Bathyarchaeota archaeon]